MAIYHLYECWSNVEAPVEDGRSPGSSLIKDAVRSGSLQVLEAVMEMRLAFPRQERYAGSFEGNAYEAALGEAALTNNKAAFTTLCNRSPLQLPLSPKMQRLMLFKACQGSAVDIARHLFTMSPSLDPNFDLFDVASVRSSTIEPVEALLHTPLQEAARGGRIALVKLLLDHGADPNYHSADDHRPNALVQATIRGYQRCMKALIDAGTNGKCSTGWRSLIPAVLSGDPTAVKLILDSGFGSKEDGESYATRALQEAHIQGVRSIIKMLIEQGYDNAKALELGRRDVQRYGGSLDLTSVQLFLE